MKKILRFMYFFKKEQSSPATLQNINVLLVEDNEISQYVALTLLRKAQFKPDVASNGQEALDMLRIKRYDIILMDILMPILDGCEATEIIRNKFPEPLNQTPIIALTSYLSDDERSKYLEVGMNDCISKPLDISELKVKIADILRSESPDIPKHTLSRDYSKLLFSKIPK